VLLGKFLHLGWVLINFKEENESLFGEYLGIFLDNFRVDYGCFGEECYMENLVSGLFLN
jgi:hypothetical protein